MSMRKIRTSKIGLTEDQINKIKDDCELLISGELTEIYTPAITTTKNYLKSKHSEIKLELLRKDEVRGGYYIVKI